MPSERSPISLSKIVHPDFFPQYFESAIKVIKSGELKLDEAQYLLTNTRCAIEEDYLEVASEIMIYVINMQRKKAEIIEGPEGEGPFDEYVTGKEFLEATKSDDPTEKICGYAELMARREEKMAPAKASFFGLSDFSPESISRFTLSKADLNIVKKIAAYPANWRKYAAKIKNH